MVKIIQAGMEGICGICGKPYKPGTRILKDPKMGKWVEADCYFPSHKRNANPTNASTPPEGAPDRPPKGGHTDIACAPAEAVQSSADINATVEANLDWAIGICRAKLSLKPNETLLEKHIILITELCREQHGLTYLNKEQEFKERNMREMDKRKGIY